jgi:hypothetical protein
MINSSIGTSSTHECSEAEYIPLVEILISLRFSLLALVGLWIFLVWIVNPVGDFMVNDDWSFIKALETVVFEGRMGSTGWGPTGAPGGPALIAHLSWGRLFTYFLGHSVTTLRISVLTMGFLGSVAFLILLRSTGASSRISLLGAVTLVMTPFFLPLCFSYMTDITFTSLAILSLLFLHRGVESTNSALIAVGLFVALGSILTRQIGIVLPIGFVLACWIHPKAARLGRWKMLVMAVGISIIPWLMCELALAMIGSTPITQHQVFQSIVLRYRSLGFLGYLNALGGHLLFAFLYTGFFISPVLALRYREFLQWRAFRYFLFAWVCGVVLFEIGLLTGLVNAPVMFWRNTLYNFGVGPVLLKDTYVLGIPRSITIPATFYYVLFSWAVLSLAGGLIIMISSVRRIVLFMRNADPEPMAFAGVLSLTAGLTYLLILVFTSYHDRYLLPLIMFGILWVLSDVPIGPTSSFDPVRWAPIWIPLLFTAVFTVLAVHDFVALKRAQYTALNHLVKTEGVDPCYIDGGFEFNGYYCYRQAFRPKPNLSWWWVDQEEYLIALGPLPGYRVVRTYPFDRYMGADGAIHVLKPVSH